jgi:hypothetical protein
MMKLAKHTVYLVLAAGIAASFLTVNAFALDQIVHPWQSIRSSGMGGLRYTTGLYDENFFGNPARATANPKWKVQIIDVEAEATGPTFSTVGSLVGGNDVIGKLAEHAGDNNHVRFQTSLPVVYLPNLGGGKWSYQLAPLLLSLQADAGLRRSYQVSPNIIADLGPAFTIARKFHVGIFGSATSASDEAAVDAPSAPSADPWNKDKPKEAAKAEKKPVASAAGVDEDNLSVGVTAHATYRVATKQQFGLVDLIRGESFGVKSGGDGAHLDFDLGTTYILPIHPLDIELQAGAAINNLLGGNYSNLSKGSADLTERPLPQPRSLGFGMSASKAETGVFTRSTVALEFSDIGNNANGSLFRTVHLGGETRLGVLAFRLGVNQGYLGGGLGLDLRVLTLDVATYGEEMSLNVGGQQDRRYAFKLGIQI